MLFQGSLLQHLGEHTYLRRRCKLIILFGWEAAGICAEVLQATHEMETLLLGMFLQCRHLPQYGCLWSLQIQVPDVHLKTSIHNLSFQRRKFSVQEGKLVISTAAYFFWPCILVRAVTPLVLWAMEIQTRISSRLFWQVRTLQHALGEGKREGESNYRPVD